MLVPGRMDVRRMAVASTALTWGKGSLGLAELLGQPGWLALVLVAAASASIAGSAAVLILRADPRKATVMAIIGIPLPARLDAAARRHLLGAAVAGRLAARLVRPLTIRPA